MPPRRGALCLSSEYRRVGHCGKLDADGYAHHAYTTRGGPFFRPPGRNAVDRLAGVVRAAGPVARLTGSRRLDHVGHVPTSTRSGASSS